MLIPSIDLQGGRIVQLVQGEKLAVETTDVDGWIERFSGYPKVQLIDLDAAKNAGANEALGNSNPVCSTSQFGFPTPAADKQEIP